MEIVLLAMTVSWKLHSEVMKEPVDSTQLVALCQDVFPPGPEAGFGVLEYL